MIAIKNMTVEVLGEYLISLSIEKGFVYDVMTSIEKLDNALQQNEYLDVSFSHQDNKLEIVIKIINDNKPPTVARTFEYLTKQKEVA